VRLAAQPTPAAVLVAIDWVTRDRPSPRGSDGYSFRRKPQPAAPPNCRSIAATKAPRRARHIVAGTAASGQSDQW